MSWNYRIVRYREGGYGLHEVFYDKNDQPHSMTKLPAAFVCSVDEGPSGIRATLFTALGDARERPVFDEPEPGKWPGKGP